jgi:pyruvate/2-oxoglutarate dehydrogenase complex dihydrolipoamide dehydrogenase (E3) component
MNDPESLLQPLDAHNLRHLANVHPAGHVNPKPQPRYHLVVIGAGPGGLVAAAAGAALGARVALVEKHLMGGDCLNVGCVPSKALIRAARAWHASRHGRDLFGAPAAGPTDDGDFGAVMERMRRLRADMSQVDSVERFRRLGVDVFLGEGRFAARDVVEVAGARLRFRRAVIATGARPALPPVPGLAEAAPLTNENLFWLTERPRRLLVIGAGPIGCEMSQAFARLGSAVTLVNRGDRLLPREDPDAARIVAGALERDGVRLQLGAKVLEVSRHGSERTVVYERQGRRETTTCDQLLVATGRLPNIERLGLEAAGVAATGSGVTVDARLRTTNHRIYALGDVCSPFQFTHVADAHARMVVRNALFFGRASTDALVMPWCTYTSPEIAHVGMYAADAERRGIAVDTITVPLAELDRAVLDGATDGFARVHLRRGSDRILGATIVSEHAGEMIGELALAITARVGLGSIAETIHPYPTQAEIIRKVADAWRRTKLTPAAKKLFARYFRIVR